MWFKDPVLIEAGVGEEEEQSVWFLGVNMKARSVNNRECLFSVVLCVHGVFPSVTNTEWD